MSWDDWGDSEQPAYQSVDVLRRRAAKAARKLEKTGRKLSPARAEGRSIARSFWGKAWCKNLESYSDYEHRLPRGRSYLRNGAVLDLQMARGEITALVQGTELYEVAIRIAPIKAADWRALKQRCAGQVGSLMDLLQGKLSASVMEIVVEPETGLFPAPREIRMNCSCPDYADLCKHAAAALYGVGVRLDEQPELLFSLRGVDAPELTAEATKSVSGLSSPSSAAKSAPTLDDASLAEVFGIEIDLGEPPAPAPKPVTTPRQTATKKNPKTPGPNPKSPKDQKKPKNPSPQRQNRKSPGNRSQ